MTHSKFLEIKKVASFIDIRYYWRMNRRNFLTALFALPAVAAVAKVAPEQPKQKIIMSSTYGTLGKNWDILSPQEIADAGFVWVVHPTFYVGDQSYGIKTKELHLHLWLPPEGVEAFTMGRKLFRGCKEEAIRQIKQIGFTHVYSVKFDESPLYNVQAGESIGHMAFVRGANVFWYRGSAYEAAVNRV